jgi:hypothetical protein
MTFGPDGKLYIVIGELNRNGQLQNVSGGAAADNTGVIFASTTTVALRAITLSFPKAATSLNITPTDSE